MSSVARIRSETGWDALSDAYPIIVRLLSGPATLEELAVVAGEIDLVSVRRRLARLIREGVVVQRDGRFESTVGLIDTDQQEGMLTSLSRYLLPVVMKLASDPSAGFVRQIDLDLDEGDQEALCLAGEQDLIEALNEASEVPAPTKWPYALVVIGTSMVPPPAPPEERLVETLKRCAQQRSTPELAARSMLRRYTASFGDPSAAEALVRRAAERASVGRPGKRFTAVYAFCPLNGDVR